MSAVDIETKRKLREMGATDLLEAIESQDEFLSMALSFDERLRLIIDHAHGTFTDSKVMGLIRRAALRYPNADLRQVDFIEERGLTRNTLTTLANCSFVLRAAEARYANCW